MNRLIFGLTAVLLSGCAPPYIPPDDLNASDLIFELLTPSGNGGGALIIGSDTSCKVSHGISSARLGHDFLDDKNIIKTRIKPGTDITLRFFNSGHYGCSETLSFVSDFNAVYYATYEYRLPGCMLNIYKVEAGRRLVPVKVKECSEY